MLYDLQFLNPNIAFPVYPSFPLTVKTPVFQYQNNTSDSGTVYITDRNNHIS